MIEETPWMESESNARGARPIRDEVQRNAGDQLIEICGELCESGAAPTLS